MNLLAHAYLSGYHQDVLIGNLVGDFYKGYGFLKHSNELFREGILLHRFIDEFMDTHPNTKYCKKLLWDKYRHYSGVLVDIFYDHFLAKNWSDYSDVTLKEFSENCYDILRRNNPVIPPKAHQMVEHMIANNWFESYQTLDGIERTLKGMSRRTKYVSGMEQATQDLYLFYEEFGQQFQSYFPQVAEECFKMRSKYE